MAAAIGKGPVSGVAFFMTVNRIGLNRCIESDSVVGGQWDCLPMFFVGVAHGAYGRMNLPADRETDVSRKFFSRLRKTQFVCFNRPVLSLSKDSARTTNLSIFSERTVRPEALEG